MLWGKQRQVGALPHWVIPATLCVLGGLNNGYNQAVMAEAMERMKWVGMVTDNVQEGLIMSALQLGMMFGLPLGSVLGDRAGRLIAMMLGELVVALFTIAQIFAPGVYSLFALRTGLGVGIGLCTLLKPLYASELASPVHRGKLLVLFSVCTAFGAQLSAVWDSLFPVLPPVAAALLPPAEAGEAIAANQWLWRCLLVAGAFPAFALLVLGLFFAPESPVWVQMQAQQASDQELLSLNAEPAGDSADSAEHSQSVVAQARHRRQHESFIAKCRQLWGHREVRVATLLGLLYDVLWIGLGVNLILMNRESIMDRAVTRQRAHRWVFALTMTNLVGPLVALVLIDLVGRKPLIRVGARLCAAANLVAGLAFLLGVQGTLPGLAVAVSVFAATLPSAAFLPVISELFAPGEFRAVSMSIILNVGTLLLFAGELLYPPLLALFGEAGWFLTFASITSLASVPLLNALPETKHAELGQGV